MAKDGTGRGGARIGAGRKRKSLTEKVLEGEIAAVDVLTADVEDFKIPAPKKYLTAEQKTGKAYAGKIYTETYKWLKGCGCAAAILPQLVSNFAQAIGRHIQAEEMIGQAGFLTRHPVTGEAMASPLVKVSLEYLRQAQQTWYQIFQVAKENSVAAGTGNGTDTMELILRRTRQGS